MQAIQTNAVQVCNRRWVKSLVVLFLITGLVVVDAPVYAAQAPSKSTILGTTGRWPFVIVLDAAGNVYTANYGSDNVSKITPAGVSTILGTTGSWPRGIVLDAAGNIYTANYGSDNVSKITPAGVSTTTTTVAGAKPQVNIFAGTFCKNKLTKLTDIELRNILWNVQMLKRGVNYRIGGATIPKISSAWGDEKRCVSAEMISRLSKSGKISPGVESKCVDETYWFGRGDMPFFPPQGTQLSATWFFGPLLANRQDNKKMITEFLGDCGGISRNVATCADSNLVVDDAQVKNVPINLIKHGCMFAPDGRLVLENLAPVWKKKYGVQILVHSFGVTDVKVANDFEGTRFDLPANGCLSQMEDSECKEGFNPLELTPGQKCLINTATRHLGFLYGKRDGLSGINAGLKLSKETETVTYDCVSLAKVLVPKIKNVSASEIFKNATWVDWKTIKVIKITKNMDKDSKLRIWKDISVQLPVGTLLSTDNHVRVVVGHLQLQDGTFNPIVVEAANSFVGVVRAKIMDIDTLAGLKTKIVKTEIVRKAVNCVR